MAEPTEPAGRPGRGRWPVARRVAGGVATGLASLLVLFALLAPEDVGRFTPGAFLRVPVEGLVAVALVLVLPPRPRRVVAVAVGVALGLLTIGKLLDMGFYATLARPFDPVLDRGLAGTVVDFFQGSLGRAGGIVAVLAIVALVVAVLFGMTRSVLRLTRVVGRHRTAATRAVAALGALWVACAAFGVPAAGSGASSLAYRRAAQIHASLNDRDAFAAQAAVDAFRHTPDDELLTALRGKDVVLAFVESYGRSAVESPRFAPQVNAVLDEGTRRLKAAGFASRSAFLTSPTAGGGSWLAHATLQSGLWVNNQQRYGDLVAGDRLTLTSAFRRTGAQTVSLAPGNDEDWPEGSFYGYDRGYDARNMGYQGKPFSWISSMPDQYTLGMFERTQRDVPDRRPLWAEVDLTSSHEPWAPIPRLVGWNDVGDGSVFTPMTTEGETPQAVWRDHDKIRAQYRRSIEYSLSTLISYVETYGDDNLVLVFLGDHQPAPLVVGSGASRDVPITIVARDPAVLDRISGWGWQDGLRPGRHAPVWRMDAFRDRFLTAFGSTPRA